MTADERVAFADSRYELVSVRLGKTSQRFLALARRGGPRGWMGRNRGLGVSLMATLDERASERVPMLRSMIAIEQTCGV